MGDAGGAVDERMTEWAARIKVHGVEHRRLVGLMPCLPGDYGPWGEVERWKDGDKAYPDCSSGCRYYHVLDGSLGADWGVCTNPASHRVGLLTFEHQGCQQAAWCPCSDTWGDEDAYIGPHAEGCIEGSWWEDPADE